MKKLLALILVLMMSVFVFAACSEKEAGVADETPVVTEIAEACLAKIVALDDTALDYTVAEKGAYTVISGKITALAGLAAKFDATIDDWEIPDENKEELKTYAAEKADAIVASFAAGAVESVTVSGDKANANCKATLLNNGAADYSAAFKVDEEEKALKDMTVDELKAVVDGIAETVQGCVVDTEVAFMLDKIDGEWFILNAGISAVE